MNDTPSTSTATPPDVEIAREHTRQASIVGWTGGLSAFFSVGALATSPTWPVAVGVAALAGMVAVICQGILKRR
jgi:predicted lipid-binding transport protein (Tim44 family)